MLNTPFGVFFLFATPADEVYFSGKLPKLAYDSPSVFLTLSTTSSFTALWVCFTPLPRPGFTLQGFSPLPS
jgi:hypothetical protein